MNGEFTRADLEVTGAILRCEGSIKDLSTGRVLDLNNMIVDEAIRMLSVIKNETHGIGWAYADSLALVPVDECITVRGAEGQRETFTSFQALADFRRWAGKVSYWSGKPLARPKRVSY